MQTVIYTIAKNEAHNVAAFMQAAEDCPVYVLDTGSTDDTVDLFKKHGAIVEQKIITPWRFDTARNEALALVPKDKLCVSLDLDERIESGWQKKLKDEWHPEANYGNYRYIGEWRDKEKTIPAVESARTRIHSAAGFHWERVVHEIPVPDDPNSMRTCDTSILVKHFSNDIQRNYAPLLTTILEQNPNDADARLQRGGEFAQKHEWENALIDYQAWLKLTFGDDRPVMRYRRATTHVAMAHCYYYLNQQERCLREFYAAIAAEPMCREAWVHLAHIHSTMGETAFALGAAHKALLLKQPPYYACTDSFCWSDFPQKLANDMAAKLKGEL
jgi:glycosyltransferase involved in cell wall biosynthesis